MKDKNLKETINEGGEAAIDNRPEKRKSTLHFTILKIFIAAVLLLVLAYFGFTCEVREGSCAVILRFGAPRQEITEAGLYFKLPWPFETVVSYDNRVQYYESGYLETMTRDKRNIILQSYVIWEISDPILYHNRVALQGSGDAFIRGQIFSATNSTLGKYDLTALVSTDINSIKNEEICNAILNDVKEKSVLYGINVKDIGILRLSLPDNTLQSVFDQMEAERQSEEKKILEQAQQEADKIKQEADKEASATIADGKNQANQINSATAAEVAKIYADASAANLDLYKFMSELDTIASSVNQNTILIVRIDEYPFNVLKKYSDMFETDGQTAVIDNLAAVLDKLSDDEKKEFIDAVYALIEANKQGEGNS